MNDMFKLPTFLSTSANFLRNFYRLTDTKSEPKYQKNSRSYKEQREGQQGKLQFQIILILKLPQKELLE